MSSANTSSATPGNSSSINRRKGSHKPRGGFGKYLRARGRGPRRPAEFGERLLLEGEAPDEEEVARIAEEQAIKYGKRQLVSNADRYEEPLPASEEEPGSDFEVDLSVVPQGQLSLFPPGTGHESDSDVDHTAMRIESHHGSRRNQKGKAVQIDWNSELTEMGQEKRVADANRELKLRLRAANDRARGDITSTLGHSQRKGQSEASSCTGYQHPSSVNNREDMQDFLDTLLG